MVVNGFKKTEIGEIPIDWGVDKVKNHAMIATGERNTQDKIDDGKYPFFVRSQNVEKINSYSFDGEAVLTAGDGVGTGKVFHYINGKFDFHQRVYKISNFKPDLDGYFFYNIFSRGFYERIMSMTAKSSVDSVRMDMIADMFIPLPDIKEQKKISEVLADINALISTLEKLIVKKRAIKTAVMQKLLTGEKRLPGFSRNWCTKKLGQVCDIVNGGTPRTTNVEYWNGSIPWCTPTDITAQIGKYLLTTERTITELGLLNSSANLLPAGAILLCTRATIGEVKIAKQPIATNQGFKSLICHDEINNEYLYYLLLTLKSKLIEKSVGSTFLEVSKDDLCKLIIHIPEIEEQIQIAMLLSDIDEEITYLIKAYKKFVSLKTGMMQELLTGRTRLI